MGKLVECPGACGTQIDYDAAPNYSTQKAAPGKWCSTCGHPLDEETAKTEQLAYGPDTAGVRAARVKSAKAFHAASTKGKVSNK